MRSNAASKYAKKKKITMHPEYHNTLHACLITGTRSLSTDLYPGIAKQNQQDRGQVSSIQRPSHAYPTKGQQSSVATASQWDFSCKKKKKSLMILSQLLNHECLNNHLHLSYHLVPCFSKCSSSQGQLSI